MIPIVPLRTVVATAASMGIAVGGLACGGGVTGPDALEQPSGRPVTVTVELREDVPTFKVDGRLRAIYELAPPFAGGSSPGVIVLPAGERAATGSFRLPELVGALVLREITSSPSVPFLCGSSGLLDPRVDAAVTVAIELCQP